MRNVAKALIYQWLSVRKSKMAPKNQVNLKSLNFLACLVNESLLIISVRLLQWRPNHTDRHPTELLVYRNALNSIKWKKKCVKCSFFLWMKWTNNFSITSRLITLSFIHLYTWTIQVVLYFCITCTRIHLVLFVLVFDLIISTDRHTFINIITTSHSVSGPSIRTTCYYLHISNNQIEIESFSFFFA